MEKMWVASLLLLLIFFVGGLLYYSGSQQVTVYRSSTTEKIKEENNNPVNTVEEMLKQSHLHTPVCGDGICEIEEENTCPQDCEPYKINVEQNAPELEGCNYLYTIEEENSLFYVYDCGGAPYIFDADTISRILEVEKNFEEYAES